MIHRSAVAFARLVMDAWTDVTVYPLRSAFASLGTVLGVAVLLASAGATSSASAQLVTLVDDLSARTVQVYNFAGADFDSAADPAGSFGFDAATRAERLDGVVHAATLSDLGTHGITSTVVDPGSAEARVMAASPDIFTVTGASLSGRGFNPGVAANAVIGRALAARLELPTLDRGPSIRIRGSTYPVVGIIESVETRNDLLSAVVLSEDTAAAAFGLQAPATVLMAVTPLSARVVSSQISLAVQPSGQGHFDVVTPPEPKVLRAGIAAQTRGLLFAVSGLCLLLGAIGIANTTLVSVLERRSEIGLRRALGARRHQIVAHFVTEGAIVGLVGSIVGAATGVLAVLAIATIQNWPPTIEPRWLVLAPTIGLAVGIIAGLYPAMRSSHMEPVECLRS